MLIARENKTAGVQIQIICLLKAKNIFAPLLGVLFRVSLRCACVAVKFAETPPLRHGEHGAAEPQPKRAVSIRLRRPMCGDGSASP
jgi:hypothetical protein